MIITARTATGHTMLAFLHESIPRILGRTLPTRADLAIQKFSESPANPLIDLASIPPYDRYQENISILNQKQVGSCTAHGCTAAVMKARDLANMTYVALSPDSLYAQIDGDSDQGSNPSDGVVALQQAGVCTLADVPDDFVLWNSISAQAKQTALRFRVAAAGVYSLANFAELVTADYLGFATILTINVGNNFNPDSSGIVGYSPGTANHCVSGGEAFKMINGQPAYRFRNSWTTSWGVNGCGWFTARYIDQQPQRELFAIKWVLTDPIDPSNPPRGV